MQEQRLRGFSGRGGLVEGDHVLPVEEPGLLGGRDRPAKTDARCTGVLRMDEHEEPSGSDHALPGREQCFC